MKISTIGKRRFNQLICTNLATPSGFSWNNSSRTIQTVRVFFDQTSYVVIYSWFIRGGTSPSINRTAKGRSARVLWYLISELRSSGKTCTTFHVILQRWRRFANIKQEKQLNTATIKYMRRKRWRDKARKWGSREKSCLRSNWIKTTKIVELDKRIWINKCVKEA